MAAKHLVTMLILLPIAVFSIGTKGKFTRDKGLDGYRCNDGNVVYKTENKMNIFECLRHCNADCIGVFYQSDVKLCLICSSLCEIDNKTDVLSGTLCYRRDVCPVTNLIWISLPNSCSKIQIRTQEVTQPEASAICASKGAKLIKIDEYWKMDFVVAVLQTCEGLPGGQYWVDGSNANATDYHAPGAWRFSDGSVVSMDKYYWGTNAPNHPHRDHCFRLLNYRFNDRGCDFKFRFICEKS